MPINNITQTISTLPEAGKRGIDVQTIFVTKQEDFQDHLQGITVTELNTFKDQLNLRIGEVNSTVTTMNGYADTASAGASTATTKAGEASTSASGALTSRNQAETFKNNASASATKASQWAENNYNDAVETGKYSAKHWATVAETIVVDTVKLTGNQTIAGVKTFSSTISGSITGNAGTATKLDTARTINGVSFDGSANITVSDSTAVKLTGNQTIAGIKTFSSPISGNFIGSIQFNGSTGNAFDNSNITVNGNGLTNTIKPSIGFHQPGLYAGTLSMLDENTFQLQTQSGQPATLSNNITGNAGSATYAAAFTTAVGSAPSYACRAWVNFNGTGTVYIRASGNVSSITDNGIGDYTVNFTTAMVDANYCVTGSARSTGYKLQIYSDSNLPMASNYSRILTSSSGATTALAYAESVYVAIFR